ncbi:hypothetical protein KL86PLE_40096 [uncultured Pleomorphomonas sp.]|uniref:Uncharacterized protein n=1 Tax=uncultured Pleomorphomonas sp. TaxID=442121 RepID=A0A212LFF6_9HYPH|nr:hypothetical protein KL86PLE_40096 [uncultured Pleomorphomonas sp.]
MARASGGKALVVSTAATRSPCPSANRISVIVPPATTMRLALGSDCPATLPKIPIAQKAAMAKVANLIIFLIIIYS